MNKIRNLLIALLAFCTLYGYSQGYDQLKVQLQFETYYGTALRSAKERRETVGPIFLNDDWLPVEVELPNGTVTFDQAKLNIMTSAVEVIYKDQEKVIASGNLKHVTLTSLNRKFIPASKIKYETPLSGFLEVLGTTAPFMMTQHYIYVKKPNFDGYVNAGTVDDQLMKGSNNFYFDGEKLTPVSGRRDIEKIYSSKKHEVKSLSKSLRTDFRDPRSIQKLIDSLGTAE